MILFIMILGSSYPLATVSALSKEQKKVFQKNAFYYNIDPCSTISAGEAATTASPVDGGPSASGSDTKKGTPLGGVANTGFTQKEIDQAKARASGGEFKGANDFLVTTYGPPWDSMEGTGVTSTGQDLKGPDNNHGKPRYVVAVDPSVIPYGTLVTVWPNALGWRGAFLAGDTGGAIKGHHVDVYDWSGDGTKDKKSYTNAEVKPYTGTMITADGSAAGDLSVDSQLGSLSQDPSLAANCCNSASVSVTAGTGSPTGTTFPDLDPNAMAQAIDKWIEKNNPNSVLKGLGATMVASAKQANVNPFILATIPRVESGLGDPNDFNVSHGNNAYGRTAAPGQPQFQGSRAWYKWSSAKASVDYTAPENKASGSGGDMATYLRAVYSSALDSNDFTALFMKYAPPSENNTAAYIANIKQWLSELVALANGGGGSSAGGTSTAASASSTDTIDPCCPPTESGADGSTGATTEGSGDGGASGGGNSGNKPAMVDLSGKGMPSGGKFGKIDALIIHYTQGNQEGNELLNVFKNTAGKNGCGSGCGIQFNVGKTGKIYQYFPLDDLQITSHTIGANSHAIGIEITGADGESLINNDAQFASVVKLATYLCDRYNIPCSNPAGDITGASEAKGMIGHDEAPGNDHSDPDTKITYVGGSEKATNIATGKPWTEADRKDASTHAYMIKLRGAMGFKTTPGSKKGDNAVAGSSIGGGGGQTCSSGGAAGNGQIPTGNSKELAKQLLDLKDQGKYKCDNPGDCQDLERVAAGQDIGAQCGVKTLDERLLKLIIYLINNGYKIGTYALCGDHHNDGLNGHTGGKAVDISSVNGKAINQASSKEIALQIDRFIFKLTGELAPRQIISAGVGATRTVDPDFVKYNRVEKGIEGQAAVTAFGPETMAGHTDHIHVGY